MGPVCVGLKRGQEPTGFTTLGFTSLLYNCFSTFFFVLEQ